MEYYVDGWERSSLRCGLYDDQNGIFFEYDGTDLYCCRRSSIRQISGYANLEFKSGKVVGINTKFASQISVGEYVVIKGQSHRVSRIDGDNIMYIVPSYRGVTQEKVIITKTETTRVPQANWSLDTCDGTGYTGFKLITLGTAQVRFALDLRTKTVTFDTFIVLSTAMYLQKRTCVLVTFLQDTKFKTLVNLLMCLH